MCVCVCVWVWDEDEDEPLMTVENLTVRVGSTQTRLSLFDG